MKKLPAFQVNLNLFLLNLKGSSAYELIIICKRIKTSGSKQNCFAVVRIKAVLCKGKINGVLFHITLKQECFKRCIKPCKSHTLFHITLKPQIHLKSGIIAVFTKNR